MHKKLLLYFMIAATPLAQSFLFWERRRSAPPPCDSSPCSWSWGSCSRTCGGGTQRPIITRSRGACGSCNLPSSRSCNTNYCPVNCRWGLWENWGSCSVSCDGGMQSRNRSEITSAQHGGMECSGDRNEERSCNDVCCPIDCVWGNWSLWDSCSASCGSGIQARERNISMENQCGGFECHGNSSETSVCNNICCPVNCSLSDWSEWNSCNATCGTGTQNRSRVVEIAESCGGRTCVGALEESRNCNTQCCPVSCQLSDWGNWSDCSKTCGPHGVSTRNRSIAVTEKCGGPPCVGDLQETIECNNFCMNGGQMANETCDCKSGWSGECCENDVDECSDGIDNCDENASCMNMKGSFICTCHDGYSGNGSTCFNLNECEDESHNCSVNAICTDNDGSYKCTCTTGYTGNGSVCENLNECQDMSHNCGENAICTDNDGSYECTCKIGYIGNGNVCEDVDECSDGIDNCDENASCMNMKGSFICTCHDGYLGNGSTCFNLNECEDMSHNCSENAICTDSDGSYECTCKIGYIGNGSVCEANLCSDLNCSSNAICILNENRTSSCKCNSGFRGDPYRLCQPYCASERLKINQVSYSFPDTWDKQFAYSIETCHNTTRSIASVFCKNSKFEVSDAVVVACNISPTSIKVDDSLKNLTETELQNLTNVLRLVTSSENRTLNENQSDFLVSVLNTALANDVKVNPSSFSNTMVVLSDVLYNANNANDSNLQAVELVEKFASRVVLPNGTNSIEIETNELVAKVYKVDVENANDPSARETQSVSDNVVLRDAQTNNTEVAVEFDLPIGAFTEGSDGNSETQKNQQFFTTYYKASSLFPSKSNVTSVFSISLASNVSTTHLQAPLKIRFSNQDYKLGKTQLSSNHLLAEQTKLECRFWNFSTNQWSGEGCCLNQSQSPPVCQCNHLTNFALLVAIDKVPNDVILNYISDVGCVLSIIGLGITITLHLLIAERRRIQTTKVFLNVCINLMVAYIIFVSGIDQASNKSLCSAITVLLHYFFLTSWFWMTAYCFDLYLNLIKVVHAMSSSAVVKGSYVFGYVIPMIIVGLTSIITLGHLDKSDSEIICNEENMLATSFYRADNMCWLHGYSLYIGFILPVGLLLIINLSIYALILNKVICNKKKIGNVSLKMSQRRILTISLSLFSTMGLSWIVGFFMLVSTDPGYSLALSWVFAIVTTSQGLLIFVTSCLLQANVRKEARKWTGSFRSAIGRKSITSSVSTQMTSPKTS